MSELLAAMESFEDLLDRIPDTSERLRSLFEYLQASEAKLVKLINAAQAGEKHLAPPENEEGDLEFGFALYWLQHPVQEHIDVLMAHPALSITTQALVRLAPPSTISEEMFNLFSGIAYEVGFVAADGSLYTLGKYAQIDPLWLVTIANYAINLLDPDSVHSFPTAPYRADIGAGKQNISIAILGDWGTGAYDTTYDGHGPAVAVMDAVRSLKPDYVVHLGDVYYSGTDERLPPNEEQENLLKQWHTGTGAKTSFTLNSNHEMYGGAQGLIGVALADGTPFEHQKQTSYFALDFGKWVILGLDSAYFDPSNLYMKGALSQAGNTQQQDFIRTNYGHLGENKVFVMTHHNPISFDGTSFISNSNAGINLWNGMRITLGGRNPDVWYWGHLHLGVVYNQNSATGMETLGRCVGHSAIPYGDAHGMITRNVDYYAHTPLNVGTRQVQNGFAVVTLGADGSLTEAFYEIDASGRCVKKWASSSN